ncbi:MAG: hypothetical protein HY858_02910 [Candidatus Solibacter usitatus]|nr:hypothetical protein [Candidatus Solibacter usitatus]
MNDEKSSEVAHEESRHYSIQHVANQAAAYQNVLDGVKQTKSIAPLCWYPHDTLGELYMFADLLEGEDRELGRLLYQGPILDLCCGDGDLAFFLASQGCTVDAVDWPPTNYNAMAGVRAMRETLSSAVQIEEVDLNGAFRLATPFLQRHLLHGGSIPPEEPFDGA